MKRWFHPEFETDLIEAARYLNLQRNDLGLQFIDEVEAGIESVMKMPEAWRAWHGTVRRFVLTRFHYTIRYRVRHDEGAVEFLSLVHTSQHPQTGLDR